MTHKIIAKYIKNLKFEIPNAKTFFLLEKEISNYKINIEIKSRQLKEKIIAIKKKLSNGLPTIPSTIKEELECNIFLRSEDKFIQQNLKSNNSLETYSKLRDIKDNF